MFHAKFLLVALQNERVSNKVRDCFFVENHIFEGWVVMT